MNPEVQAPNERSRIYLTLAMMESGTVSVNDQIRQFGVPFDVARRGGMYYSDKAPGSSIVALPAMKAYQILGGDISSMEQLMVFTRWAVMIPFALLTLFLLRWLVVSLAIREEIADLVVIVFALGTSFFHYGSAFYGHALVTCFSLAAACCVMKSLQREQENRGKREIAWQWGAGFCGAMAFLVEYQAVVILGALFLGFIAREEHRKWAPMASFSTGAFIPTAAVFFYNTLAFGHPLSTSYSHLVHGSARAVHEAGLFGITYPSWEAIYGLILSPSRGLLFCAPLVLVGVMGLGLLWKRARWLAIYAGVSLASFLVLATGARDVWFAGWSFGPRLLVPIFGLAAVGAALVMEELEERAPVLLGGLGGLFLGSIFYNTLVSSTFPELPPRITAPLTSVSLELLQGQGVSPNLGQSILGMEATASVVLLVAGALLLGGLAILRVASTGEVLLARHSKLKAAAGCGAALAIFMAVLWLYPEQTSPESVESLVERLERRDEL